MPFWHAIKWRNLPRATRTMIWVFVAVYLSEFFVLAWLGGAAYKVVFTQGPDWGQHPWQVFTNIVAHQPAQPIVHFAVNLVGFWCTAPFIERRFGARTMLAIFLITGVASGIVQAALVPKPTLGASGSIMAFLGVLGATTWPTGNPWRLEKWFLPFVVVAAVVKEGYGMFQPYSGFGHAAHVVGLLSGLGIGIMLRLTSRTTSGQERHDGHDDAGQTEQG